MSAAHRRYTGPMLSSPRCGAKTRSGKPCRSPAVSGKKRCRMHGGAPGSGAPRGNKNALKHGNYTREAIALRRYASELMRRSRALIKQITCEQFGRERSRFAVDRSHPAEELKIPRQHC
jgi:hypothetical protein